MSDVDQQSVDITREQLMRFEHYDRVQRLLESLKMSGVGFLVITPSTLSVIAFQRWESGLSSSFGFVAAGFSFVGFLGIVSVISLIQWACAKQVVGLFAKFDMRMLEQIPQAEVVRQGYGPFRIEHSSQYVVARRPWVRCWRLHRPLVILLAIITIVGIRRVLWPIQHTSISPVDLFKFGIVTLSFLAVIWYARKQKVVAWVYVRDQSLLTVQRLVGVVCTETVSYSMSDIEGLQFESTNSAAGKLQAVFRVLSVDGGEVLVPLPLDPIFKSPSTSHQGARNMIQIIRLMLFLRLMDQSISVIYYGLADPKLGALIHPEG